MPDTSLFCLLRLPEAVRASVLLFRIASTIPILWSFSILKVKTLISRQVSEKRADRKSICFRLMRMTKKPIATTRWITSAAALPNGSATLMPSVRRFIRVKTTTTSFGVKMPKTFSRRNSVRSGNTRTAPYSGRNSQAGFGQRKAG